MNQPATKKFNAMVPGIFGKYGISPFEKDGR
jgi:hypothetical protein